MFCHLLNFFLNIIWAHYKKIRLSYFILTNRVIAVWMFLFGTENSDWLLQLISFTKLGANLFCRCQSNLLLKIITFCDMFKILQNFCCLEIFKNTLFTFRSAGKVHKMYSFLVLQGEGIFSHSMSTGDLRSSESFKIFMELRLFWNLSFEWSWKLIGWNSTITLILEKLSQSFFLVWLHTKTI